ncbi:MAG: PAS domain-containing protein, partial [Gracilibacteraceae bacterium]|nr:PAS domain-containing protein [Gracilibacteraceae bacterium]
LFPLPGGLLETGGLLAGGIGTAEVIHLSGADEVMALFADPEISRRYKYAEPLFCKGGCLNGPALGGEDDPLRRRAKIIAYAQTAPVPESEAQTAPAGTFFTAREDFFPAVTENQINKALERTGKLDPASRLNCGACGYKNCLDNARAVARGMAEPEMCMPYMRVLAQQRTDRIIETMPSGVMIVDGELNMIRMNPAFQKMFICGGDILGRRVSYLLDPEGFEKLLLGETELYESIQTRYGVRYHEIIYALREDNQYIGIYSDISHLQYNREQLDVIKAQTLRHAREFLSHQVRFAQEMADYLGKSTARSEEIARRLISLYDQSL